MIKRFRAEFVRFLKDEQSGNFYEGALLIIAGLVAAAYLIWGPR